MEKCPVCKHDAHDGADDIFDPWEEGDEMFGRECAACAKCFENLRDRVDTDRAARPAQYR